MNVFVIIGAIAVFALWRAAKSGALGDVGTRAVDAAKGLTRRVANVGGIDERVQHIIGIIKRDRYEPAVIFKAREIVSQKCGAEWCTPEKDWRAELVQVFTWFRQNIRYTRDPWNVDLFMSARLVIKFAAADCDEAVSTIASHLQALGYPIKLRVVQTTNPASTDYDHIYLLAGYNSKTSGWVWMPLDATVDMPAGWEIPSEMIKHVGGKARIRDYDIPAQRMAAA